MARVYPLPKIAHPDFASPFVRPRGPVEIVVGGQRSYVQGLILARPHEQTKARLRFGALPEIEFELPDVAPTE